MGLIIYELFFWVNINITCLGYLYIFLQYIPPVLLFKICFILIGQK